MKKIKIITNIFLALILIFILFGCNGVEVTQEKKEIEAGNKSINPVELISVKNSDKYKVKVVSNEIDTTSLGSYTVKYSITKKGTDKEYIKKFEFDVVDTTPPEIIFTEGDKVSVSIGKSFDPLDYIKVEDNHDISKQSVDVESTVDTNKKGMYNVNYFIEDSSGNKDTASLKVQVLSKAEKNAIKAVQTLKDKLKNPNSLQLHSVFAEECFSENLSYAIKIDYSAENSFGGMNRDTVYADILSDGTVNLNLNETVQLSKSIAWSGYTSSKEKIDIKIILDNLN